MNSAIFVKSSLIMGLLSVSCIGQTADLDATIKAVASQHGLEPRLLKAIAFLESSHGTNTRLNKNKNGTYDIGPFQINSVHWNTTCKDLNLARQHDNTVCAARLIKAASKHASKDKAWVGRYHSKTPSLKLQYHNKVDKILKKGAHNVK